MNYKINKKAQFISFFVVFLILVFSTLVYVMYKHNKYEESLALNSEAASTFKIYGLAERNKYYLEKAAEFSKQKAIKELELNAGHLQGQCTKSLASGKILWNTCPKLNLEENFKLLFNQEFKKYIENQYQPYPKTGYEDTLNNEDIKKLEPIPKIEDNELIINFNEFAYSLNYESRSKEAGSFSIKYIFEPLIIVKAPDFSIYNEICKVLTKCNLNQQISQIEIDGCINSLNNLDNIKISKNSQIIDLNYENLDFSVDLKTKLNCQNSLIS